ncbi:hypothetical protein F2P81_017877 [Scophthalmus maximus]|uniref:Interferon gamma n=1 Tax=Scophthalmus maximus TaxID=52904 RepID=A0A6A4SE00_SCOMX|nr:hypothetical protein F2P81_017877 [Scophthalmus maximus]
MSSSCGSVCLLVLLGVVLACGSPFKIPDTTANLLMLKEPEVGREPLFISIIRSINTSCQRKEDIRLINATLDVYKRVFSSILHHQQQQHGGEAAASGLLDKLSSSNRTRVQAHLEKLQNKMEELRGRLSRMNQDRRDEQDMLSKLKNIKVDDPLDQRKALAEFQLVYQAASLIGSDSSAAFH